MFSTYFTPITAAIFALIVIGILTAIPWMIYNYRKYGFLSFWQTVIIFSFIFYALSAYFLVILPLPDVRDTCASGGLVTRYVQPIPFFFVYEILQEGTVFFSQPSTYINFIKHPAFLPAFFNLLILFPLGVYMRYFRGKQMTFMKMLGLGFLTSLFFELTQLSGLYGIYHCPYRTFNVDDLILNTLGAGLGYLVAPIILALIPKKENLQKKSEHIFQTGRVRPLAQLLAILIDYTVVYVTWLALAGLLALDSPLVKMFYLTLGLFFMQYLVPLWTKGTSLGMRCLRFTLKREEKARSWSRALLIRWVAIIFPWFTYQSIQIVLEHAVLDMDSAYYSFRVFLDLGLFLFLVLIGFFLFIHIIRIIRQKGKQAFYFDDIAKLYASYRK